MTDCDCPADVTWFTACEYYKGYPVPARISRKQLDELSGMESPHALVDLMQSPINNGSKVKTLAEQWTHGCDGAVARLTEAIEEGHRLDARDRQAVAVLLSTIEWLTEQGFDPKQRTAEATPSEFPKTNNDGPNPSCQYCDGDGSECEGSRPACPRCWRRRPEATVSSFVRETADGLTLKSYRGAAEQRSSVAPVAQDAVEKGEDR